MLSLRILVLEVMKLSKPCNSMELWRAYWSHKHNQRPYIRRRHTPIHCLCDANLDTLIPVARWSCSRPLADSNDCWLRFHLVAGIRGAQISITGLVLSASSPNIRSLSQPTKIQYPVLLYIMHLQANDAQSFDTIMGKPMENEKK